MSFEFITSYLNTYKTASRSYAFTLKATLLTEENKKLFNNFLSQIFSTPPKTNISSFDDFLTALTNSKIFVSKENLNKILDHFIMALSTRNKALRSVFQVIYVLKKELNIKKSVDRMITEAYNQNVSFDLTREEDEYEYNQALSKVYAGVEKNFKRAITCSPESKSHQKEILETLFMYLVNDSKKIDLENDDRPIILNTFPGEKISCSENNSSQRYEDLYLTTNHILNSLNEYAIEELKFSKTDAWTDIRRQIRQHWAKKQLVQKRENNSATTLQCKIRQHWANKQLARKRLENNSATTLQCKIRQHWAKKQLAQKRLMAQFKRKVLLTKIGLVALGAVNLYFISPSETQSDRPSKNESGMPTVPKAPNLTFTQATTEEKPQANYLGFSSLLSSGSGSTIKETVHRACEFFPSTFMF